jgi:uncharacterized protein (DUF1330 family)
MSAYGIAHLKDPHPHPDVAEYLERIDATLAPFGGRFLVHGGPVQRLEGEWPGTIVIIEFPDLATARAWYDSPAYQEIVPLRARHIAGDLIIADGVGPDHDSAAMGAAMRGQLAS